MHNGEKLRCHACDRHTHTHTHVKVEQYSAEAESAISKKLPRGEMRLPISRNSETFRDRRAIDFYNINNILEREKEI